MVLCNLEIDTSSRPAGPRLAAPAHPLACNTAIIHGNLVAVATGRLGEDTRIEHDEHLVLQQERCSDRAAAGVGVNVPAWKHARSRCRTSGPGLTIHTTGQKLHRSRKHRQPQSSPGPSEGRYARHSQWGKAASENMHAKLEEARTKQRVHWKTFCKDTLSTAAPDSGHRTQRMRREHRKTNFANTAPRSTAFQSADRHTTVHTDGMLRLQNELQTNAQDHFRFFRIANSAFSSSICCQNMYLV